MRTPKLKTRRRRTATVSGPPPLAAVAGRCALMTMIIDLNLAVRDSIDPASELNANLSLVLCAVLLGHAEGEGLTVRAIERRIGMSHGSVVRRLDKLIKLGVVVRVGNGYFLEPKRAAKVPLLARFETILQTAFAVIGPRIASKMDAAASG